MREKNVHGYGIEIDDMGVFLAKRLENEVAEKGTGPLKGPVP